MFANFTKVLKNFVRRSTKKSLGLFNRVSQLVIKIEFQIPCGRSCHSLIELRYPRELIILIRRIGKLEMDEEGKLGY